MLCALRTRFRQSRVLGFHGIWLPQPVRGAPGLKSLAHFDIHHVGVAEGDVLKKFERLLPVIGHVQIAAEPSRAEPDEGEIAYDRLMRTVDALLIEAGAAASTSHEPYRLRCAVGNRAWFRAIAPLPPPTSAPASCRRAR